MTLPRTMEEAKDAYSPKRLAAKWECSEQHIRDLVRAKQLRCFYVGSLIRITAQTVKEFEEGECDSNSTEKSGQSSGLKVDTLSAARQVRQTMRGLRSPSGNSSTS